MRSSMNLIQKLHEANQFLSSKCPDFPKIAIVLGSGLNHLLENMEIELDLPYREIPHTLSPTVEGHIGKLVVGKMGRVRVACMQGRLHHYEGYSLEDLTFPFRLFAQAGAETFVLTNAAGGLHADMEPGDLVLLTDHINMMGTNPLIGKNYDTLGPRFPDMTYLYDPRLREIFLAKSKEINLKLRTGVYVATCGPSYETPAEIKMFRSFGGDVVGMSTVPEAITVHHMGKRVVGISCITNLAAGVSSQPLVHEEVLENAKKAYKGFAKLVFESVQEMEGV